MNVVCNWGANVGVTVSEGKTSVMLMKGRISVNRIPRVEMNGRVIKYVESVKYLGIWMSERMSFKIHLEYLKVKVTNIVGQMRRVLKSEWGMRKRAVRIIYEGLFVGCVMYGVSVWCDIMKYEYARALLNRYQRMLLYACLNVCKTVSTDSMQVLMSAPPWNLECERRGVVCMLKNSWSVHDNNLVSAEELDGKSVEECVSLVNERAYDRWQTRWNECVNGRVTCEYIKDVRLAERNTCFKPNVYVCFMLTGHRSMNGFLHKRGLSESARCVCGAECEDWVHVLVECGLYADLRDFSDWCTCQLRWKSGCKF